MRRGTISVIGANQGALAFAIFASEGGYDVTVYEKKKREDVSYEWWDDMNAATFNEIGIECPPVINSQTTPGVSFVSPQKTHSITLTDESNATDIPVKRRELNEMLYKRAAESGVIFNYECSVKSVIYDDEKVTGILLTDGTEVLSDFTVDCGGAESDIRKSLPGRFEIPQRINPDDMFFVTRTYYNRTKNTLGKKSCRKIYLKHLNERGISWCFPSHDGNAADVLIGRLSSLSEETQKISLYDLKNECEIIGDTPLFGGELCKIPVRRPISRMIANGFALLGDSAFMTLPMNGSGMARSLWAAKMLADVINEPYGNPFDIANLYRYQKRYMKRFGADDAPVEIIKNWLLNSNDGDVDFLMEKGILNAEILGSAGGSPDIKAMIEMVKSVASGLSKPLLLAKLAGILLKMSKQTKITVNMPDEYDKALFSKWQKEYDKAYSA